MVSDNVLVAAMIPTQNRVKRRFRLQLESADPGVTVGQLLRYLEATAPGMPE